MSCYSVHKCEFGYYIKGNISVNELVSLINSWGYKYYHDGVMDFPIAWKLGASIVVSKKDSRKAWRESLGITEDWVNRRVDEYEKVDKKEGDEGVKSQMDFEDATNLENRLRRELENRLRREKVEESLNSNFISIE
jgi:hypothetical protein